MTTAFTSGFSAGFGLVDDAIHRRRRNDLDQQHMGLENAQYRDGVKRQAMIDQRDQAWHDQSMAANEQAARLEQEKYRHQLVKDDKEFGLKEADMLSNDAYRKSQLENQSRQIGIQERQANSTINENNIETATKAFELRSAQDAKAKQEALTRFSAYVQPNANGTAVIRLPGGEEGVKALDDFKKGTGVDPVAVAASYPQYKQSFETMTQAAMNPGAFAKDPRPVLQALNTLEAVDINKGNGAYDGEDPRYVGGTIDRKEITGVLFHPPEENYPEGYYTMEVTAYGKDKDGKPYADPGPMTEFRSSSLYDRNVRGITPQQLVQRLTGHESVIQLMDSNPQFRDHLATIAKGGNGKAKGDYQPIVEENYNPETMANEKRVTGSFNKDTGEISRVAQPKQSAPADPEVQRRKAEYVLNNRDQFANRPDIIQAAEQMMRGQ